MSYFSQRGEWRTIGIRSSRQKYSCQLSKAYCFYDYRYHRRDEVPPSASESLSRVLRLFHPTFCWCCAGFLFVSRRGGRAEVEGPAGKKLAFCHSPACDNTMTDIVVPITLSFTIARYAPVSTFVQLRCSIPQSAISSSR